MTENNEPDRAAAEARLRSASRMFYLLGAAKLMLFAWALRFLFDPTLAGNRPFSGPLAVVPVLWYGASVVLCVMIAIALGKKKIGARTVAYIYGLLQIVGIVAVVWIGAFAVISAVLGLVAVTTLHIASELGAFEESDAAQASRNQVSPPASEGE